MFLPDEINIEHDRLTKTQLGWLRGGPVEPPGPRQFLKWDFVKHEHRQYQHQYILVSLSEQTSSDGKALYNVFYSKSPDIFYNEQELHNAVEKEC